MNVKLGSPSTAGESNKEDMLETSARMSVPVHSVKSQQVRRVDLVVNRDARRTKKGRREGGLLGS